MAEPERPPTGSRAFARLGRAVVRRPLVPLIVWALLLGLCLPFLSHLGSVTTNSTSQVASTTPSAEASAKLAQLFPGAASGPAATLLFVGPNLTGPTGQGVVLNVTAALDRDASLHDVASVSSVYTAFAAFLAGQTELAAGAVATAQGSNASLTSAVNASAATLWGPASLFWQNWASRAANATGGWASFNAPAFNQTSSELASNATAVALLRAFYAGANGSLTGFNGSVGACAAGPTLAAARACADGAARANELALLPTVYPGPAARTIGTAVLGGLGVENATNWTATQPVAAGLIAAQSGLPTSWIRTVWTAFPTVVPNASLAGAFAASEVANATLAREPLPVPAAIRAAYVDPAGTASLIEVDFSVPDDQTDPSGGHPVYDDLGAIDGLVPGVLAASDPTHAIRYYDTGSAPLDQLTQQAVDASLSLVLPLTVGLLLAISMIYFRSPLAPLVTFAGLGTALVLGLGGTILVGTLVTHVDATALTLEEVFVLGVGTDYSIFLVARYREGIVHGLSSDEAIVASVTWAGQSVATSGSTAIIVTIALALSGVALLSQWGLVLSVAILVTMLLSLTLVPACLKLIGPRIFWPSSGTRAEGRSAEVRARLASERTYFYRAGRATHRRPASFVAVLAAVSIPLVALALTVPVSYDFYAQLPSGHPATDGLARMAEAFGPGFAVPSFALVTFQGPLLVNNTTNAAEFDDIALLTDLGANTSGIAVVRSPVGPYGANLTEWVTFATLPPAVRSTLAGTLGGYTGTDGRTVLFSIQPSSAGLSQEAVGALNAVERSFTAFATVHPEVRSVDFGGGAPTIRDLAQQTDLATEVMLAAVAVGLVVVLLAVLRSWIIAVMAVTTIGLSIAWAWALTYLVFSQLLGFPIFFYVRTLMFMLVLGLGIDYNIFLLTRVREERLGGRSASEAAVHAVGRTGGIITAAAVILASAFAALYVGEFTLIRAIGFSVAIAVVLDAMVVRTYLVPAALRLLGERVWTLSGRRPKAPANTAPAGR